MPPRTGRRGRRNQDPTQEQSGEGSSGIRAQPGRGGEQFARPEYDTDRPGREWPRDTDKMFSIERLKKLGAQEFEGSTDPADTEIWLNRLEKCFDVMECPDERKVRLATFLLQK